jgi:predicted transcriptional regulator
MTRNLTLAVDDAVLDRYRALAAQRKTSVNAMIREHMAQTVGAKTEAQLAAIERMVERSKNAPRATYAPKLSRDDVWDREVGRNAG